MMKTEASPYFSKDRGEIFTFWVFLFLIATAFVLGVLLLIKIKHDQLSAPAGADERAHYADRLVCSSKSELCQAQQKIYKELVRTLVLRQDLTLNQLGVEANRIRSRSLELAVQEIARKDDQ